MAFTSGPHDGGGFNDDKTEDWREMHQMRNQLGAKLGCLLYVIILVVGAIFLIIESFAGGAG